MESGHVGASSAGSENGLDALPVAQEPCCLIGYLSIEEASGNPDAPTRARLDRALLAGVRPSAFPVMASDERSIADSTDGDVRTKVRLPTAAMLATLFELGADTLPFLTLEDGGNVGQREELAVKLSMPNHARLQKDALQGHWLPGSARGRHDALGRPLGGNTSRGRVVKDALARLVE